MTDCWRPSNHTKQQKFWMTFLGWNYRNPEFISEVHVYSDRWEVHGFISCLFPTYFLSVSAIIEYFHYGFLLSGTDALIFGRDVEVFWFKGVKNITCSERCCVPSQCDFNYSNYWSEYVYLLNQTSPVDGIIYNLPKTQCLVLLRHHRVFRTITKRENTQNDRVSVTNKLNVSKNSFYQSWNSASLNCERLSGHLPVFLSRKSIEEFVFLLKSGGIPFMEPIFIGLKVNKIRQVKC